MNEHALRILEFPQIRNEVESYAWSVEGKQKIHFETFFTKKEALEQFRILVEELRRLYDRKEEFPPLAFPDISEAMHTAKKPGSQLDGKELAAVAQYLHLAWTLKKFIEKRGGKLQEEGKEIPDLSALVKTIGRYIDLDGNLKEQEIPSLRALGERIRRLRREIEKLAEQYIQNPAYRGFWQMDTPSLKDGRIVLPLHINMRGKFRGIVHEISSRGATVFIEPLDIFEKNNNLVDEENEYRIEVNRILRELTGRISERMLEIHYLQERVAILDSYQARARYGNVHRCTFATISEDAIIIQKARHPLLGNQVVPIDISYPSGRILILSGPNTGGKTVALKNLGVLVIMNQFGMEIPVESATLPLFDDVFADIGDEQSISESLSTFSAHLKNLKQIFASCTSSSLVLLDELGSGTDPEEGTALAVAFLLSFLQRGVFLFGSTHLSGVKDFVFSNPGMMNASVEFDLEHLKPTYRIVLGVPGPSYALEIAERCGAPHAVLEQARALLTEGSMETKRVLTDLFQRVQEYQKRLDEVETLKQSVQEERRGIEEHKLKLQKKELELRDKGIRELQLFMGEAKREFQNLIRLLREGELTKEKTKMVHDYIQSIEQRVDQEQELQDEEKHLLRTEYPFALAPGMEVRLRNHRQKGVLVKKVKEGLWELSIGPLRMQIAEEDIHEVFPPSRQRAVQIDEPALTESPKLELDLRGMRAGEAIKQLEKQIDGAILKGLKEFSIIHGKGEGILQRSVHDYLLRCPQIAEFSFAPPESGGTGKTYVKIM